MNRDRMYDALLRRVLPVPPGWHHPRAEAQVLLRDDGRARVVLQGLVSPEAPGLWAVEVRVGGQWVLHREEGHRSFLTAAVRAEQVVLREGEPEPALDLSTLANKVVVLGAELDETSRRLDEEQALGDACREELHAIKSEAAILRRHNAVLERMLANLARRLERRVSRGRPRDPDV